MENITLMPFIWFLIDSLLYGGMLYISIKAMLAAIKYSLAAYLCDELKRPRSATAGFDYAQAHELIAQRVLIENMYEEVNYSPSAQFDALKSWQERIIDYMDAHRQWTKGTKGRTHKFKWECAD